mgnify:CR=1 FL=1
MNLYICTKLSAWATELCCVVAKSEEDALELLKNDGRYLFSVETYFPLSSEFYGIQDCGIPYSLDVEHENYEG